MISYLFSNPLYFIYSFLALVIAITIHEFSHAYMADRLGDPTPSLQGRLTLNPLAHLDPMGTILMLLTRFGWGKPVQFDPFNLRNPQRDTALIAIAGPVSNMILALLCAGIIRLIVIDTGGVFVALLAPFIGQLLVTNVVLAIFNLVPIYPLDGFKVVGGLLPEREAHQWYELERYGIFFLIILMIVPIGGGYLIQNLIGPPINFILQILLPGAPII